MRVAVVGLAGVGRVHVDRWSRSDKANLVAVCDIQPEIAQDTADRMGVASYLSVHNLLDSARPDAISVCTPPKSHLPIASAAARRGVHVLVEKPMASSVADCRAIIDACAENGVTLLVGHKKRFVPTIVRLKSLTEGELGRIRFMLHRYPHPWLSDKDWFWQEDDGGGPILENAVHAADTLGFLMGDVERVFAEGDSFFAESRAPQINCAAWTLRFVDGGIATVGSGMVSMPAFSFEDFYAATDAGIAEISGSFDNPNRLRWGIRSAPSNATDEVLDADPFALEIDHFIESIRSKTTPIADGVAGMKAVAICRAVKLSAVRREPVTIAEMLAV